MEKPLSDLEMKKANTGSDAMNGNPLVSITVSREKGEIVYSVDCSSELLNGELEYYLKEIVNGICKWKPGVCEERLQSLKGIIKKRKAK